MSKYELKSGKALTALIASISKRAATLKLDIHIAALSAAAEVARSGNVSAINQLCAIAKDVTHDNGVMRWFDDNVMFVKYSAKEKAFVVNTEFRKTCIDDKGVILPEVMEEFVTQIEASKPYYEATKAKDFTPFNAIALLKRIASKYDKMTDEERADPRNHIEGIDEIKSLVVKLAPVADAAKLKADLVAGV